MSFAILAVCILAEWVNLKIDLMYSEDDLQYALENTKVLVSPERRIETSVRPASIFISSPN